MKKIITILLTSIGLTLLGQTTTNPDTVCVNSIAEQYFVTNTPGSTYQWTITGGGGVLQSGQGTNSITVDWGNLPGLYSNAVSVIESNSTNCLGTPINLDVYVLQLNLPTISPFCAGDPSQSLGGTPLGGTYSGTGIVGNDFDPTIAGVGTHIITYSFSGCSTTINVVVNNGPTTGPIQHY